MVCKLVLVASLAVGVFCPVTSSYNRYGAYELTMENIPAKRCHAEEIKLAFEAFGMCLMHIDPDAINEAHHTRVHKTIAIRYCAILPQLKECTNGLIKDVVQCLPPEEARIFENTMFRLIDFLCHNGGERIISLIEHSPSCNRETQLTLSSCLDELQSHGARLKSQYGDGDAGARMIFKEIVCSIMDNGMSCITNALKTCASKTPAEFSQELHNLLGDSMACSGVSIILQNGVLRLILAIIFLHLLFGKFNDKC